MPRRRRAPLSVPQQIVRNAMRGADGDPLAELDDYENKFWGSARINLQIPREPIPCRQSLQLLMEELPMLVAEMDRLETRLSKMSLIDYRLRRWNRAFSKWAGVSNGKKR